MYRHCILKALPACAVTGRYRVLFTGLSINLPQILQAVVVHAHICLCVSGTYMVIILSHNTMLGLRVFISMFIWGTPYIYFDSLGL